MAARKKLDFMVIGLGRFGSSVARTLSEQGFDVLAIDINEELVQDLSPMVTHAVQADATDEEVLRSLGAGNFDVAVVAIGDNLQANILATLILKEIGVPCVVAKAKNLLHGKILDRVGADRVVFPERDMGIRLALNLTSASLQDFLEVTPNFSIHEVIAKKKWWGKSLAELEFRTRYGVNIVALMRGELVNPLPQAEDVIKEGDILVIIGKNEDLEKLER